MPIPAYMWLKDDGGADIKGSVTVQGREGSIEVIGFSHGLNLPVDGSAGKVVGTRLHSPMHIEKEFDASSPYLYKAVATGQTLQSVELKWYRINDAGKEQVYFIMLLEGVRVQNVSDFQTIRRALMQTSIMPVHDTGLRAYGTVEVITHGSTCP